MNSSPLFCIPLALALLAPACVTTKGESVFKSGFEASRITRVAVVDGVNPTFAVTTRRALIDTFEMEFLRKGWSVVERADVQRAIDELDFQGSDLASPDERGELGRLLNVQALVVVNLASAGSVLSLTAKMIETETGDVLWVGSGEGDLQRTLGMVAGVVTGAAVGAVLGNQIGSGHGGAGSAIGGVAGGAVGHDLSPNEIEHAKAVVKKVCELLPRR